MRNGSKFLHPKFVAGGRTLAYAVMEPKTDVWVGESDAFESDALDKGTIAVRGLDPVLSPDGRTVYFVGERPDQQGVFAINRSGDKGSLRKITDLKPSISHLHVLRPGTVQCANPPRLPRWPSHRPDDPTAGPLGLRGSLSA